MGLFVGVSFMSIGEIFDLIYDWFNVFRVRGELKRHNKKKDRKDLETDIQMNKQLGKTENDEW